jgi:hypothetical protein
MKKVRLCYRIVLGCFLVGIISLAPLMVYLNNQAGDFYVTTAWRTTNFATFGNINHPRDQIIAYASITHVDAQKFSFDARFRFINNHAIDGQRAGFEFATDTATKTFDPDVVLPVMDTKMTIYEGTPIQYPFDVYKGLMILQVSQIEE